MKPPWSRTCSLKPPRSGRLRPALFDAGYHTAGVITATTERDIELLCPSGRTLPTGKETPPVDKPYSKAYFTSDAVSDSYRCPAGAQLIAREHDQGKTPTEGDIRYRTGACARCEQRPRCTTSPHGRTLKHYPSDVAKAALRQAMADPEKQKRDRQRQALVEPVFSVLRLKQGLNRFRRRGLRGARRELALHVMAYNLGRALALSPLGASFSALWCWLHGVFRWLPAQLTRLDRILPSSNSAPWLLPMALRELS